jgi:hypothetical protein
MGKGDLQGLSSIWAWFWFEIRIGDERGRSLSRRGSTTLAEDTGEERSGWEGVSMRWRLCACAADVFFVFFNGGKSIRET